LFSCKEYKDLPSISPTATLAAASRLLSESGVPIKDSERFGASRTVKSIVAEFVEWNGFRAWSLPSNEYVGAAVATCVDVLLSTFSSIALKKQSAIASSIRSHGNISSGSLDTAAGPMQGFEINKWVHEISNRMYTEDEISKVIDIFTTECGVFTLAQVKDNLADFTKDFFKERKVKLGFISVLVKAIASL
jgi:hypothetical protein